MVTWGDRRGGDSRAVALQLGSGVVSLCATYSAFAALKEGGEVVVWGGQGTGGDATTVSDSLTSDVKAICGTHSAFAAIKEGGHVWM